MPRTTALKGKTSRDRRSLLKSLGEYRSGYCLRGEFGGKGEPFLGTRSQTNRHPFQWLRVVPEICALGCLRLVGCNFLRTIVNEVSGNLVRKGGSLAQIRRRWDRKAPWEASPALPKCSQWVYRDTVCPSISTVHRPLLGSCDVYPTRWGMRLLPGRICEPRKWTKLSRC